MKFGMRALVVEPHDENELIFSAFLSHPFQYRHLVAPRVESYLLQGGITYSAGVSA